MKKKISLLFITIFIAENLFFELWYRFEHRLPIFKKLSALPNYAPPTPTIFTSFFWKDHSPDNLWLALLIYIVLSIILTVIIFKLTYIIKRAKLSKL